MVARAEQTDLVRGLRLERVLGRGAHSVVWAAHSLDDGMPWGGASSLVVKLAAGSSAEHAAMLRREARFLARLRCPAIVRLWHAATTHDGREYLVLSASRHGTLADRLRDGPLTVDDALSVTRSISLALAETHRRGIVHRDVKPTNVLLDDGDQPAWLADFGLASDIGVAQLGSSSAEVAGSFLYSAPEQTGMLRREVDGRADLYALGVVLFECLSGQPPFQSTEVETLLRLHATERAPDVRTLRPDVPEALSRVVAKLLAKDPDDRYPTANSLLADIAALAGGAAPSGLAREHTSAEEHAPPLVGRGPLLTELGSDLAALRSGHGGVIWLVGEPGMGRRRACRVALEGSAALAVHVRGDDGALAFAPYRALLAALMRHARTRHALRDRLEQALQTEGPALARLFPDLLGLDAPSQEVTVDSAVEALVRTLKACAVPEEPLVVTLEGADRLGQRDLNVLLRLRTEARDSSLLVVCIAERNVLATADVRFRELRVEPLEREHVEHLIRHVLGPLPFDPRLVDVALSCSAGNPAALLGRMWVALGDGALDSDGSRWHFDEAAFIAIEQTFAAASSDEGVLTRLGDDARDVLRGAALLGRRFEPRWLESMGYAKSAVDKAVWEGIQLRLLTTSDDGSATFVRGEAFASLEGELAREERVKRYAMLAAALEHARVERHAERLLLAHAHFESAEESTAQRAFERCLEAGLAALDAFAFAEAQTLLGRAEELVRRFGLQTDFRLPRALGQLEAQGGNVDGAIARFRAAIDACPDALTRANMHARCAELRFFNENGNTGQMREHLRRAFAELGMRMPTPGPWSVVCALWYALLALFIERTGIGRGVDGVTLLVRTRLRVTEMTGMYFFFTQHIAAALHVCMLGWYFGRRGGPCRELAHGLTALANFCYVVKWKSRAERYYSEAFEIGERLGDRAIRAYARYMQGCGLPYAGEIHRGERVLAQALEQHGADLDIAYFGTGVGNLSASYMARGDVSRAAQLLERAREQMHARLGTGAQLPETCTIAELEVRMQQNRLDLAAAPVERLKRRLSSPEEDPFGWLGRFHVLGAYELLRGSDDAVIDQAFAESKRSRMTPRNAVWLVARGYLIVTFTRVEQWLRAAPAKKPERLRVMLESIAEAKTIPKNPYIDGPVCLLRAIEHWALGRSDEAERELASAEREALRWDFPGLVMEARFLRARMFLEAGRDEAARLEARSALLVAEAAGQVRRAKEIERAMSLSRTLTPVHEPLTVSLRSHSTTSAHTAQRERDVLVQVALAASRELEPTAQARVVLDRLLGLLGAERGIIFADSATGELARVAARSARGEDLDEHVTFAASLVRRVRDTGTPLVLHGTEEGAVLGSESMVAANLRSMVCAPIRLGDQVKGVLYLDSSLARGVFTRRDLEILDATGSQIAITQEVARAARGEIDRLALEKDLQLSGAVQALLLPQSRDHSVGDLHVSAAYAPASHSGGDFWAYEELDDGRVWLLLGDATGHGAGAAMVTAVLAGGVRSLLDSGVRDLPTLLRGLGETVARLCAGDHSVTMTAVEVTPTRDALTLWSAGAPPALVRAADGHSEPCVLRGTPLGTTPLVLAEAHLELTPGARVLLVTDGILEMPTQEGRELGLRRLRKIFERRGGSAVQAARDAMMAEIELARGGLPSEDDLTLLLLGRD